MLTPVLGERRNWRLPPLGAVVEVHTRPLQDGHRYNRWRVVSYPGAMIRQSTGGLGPLHCFAHCVDLECLDDGRKARVAGRFCHDVSNAYEHSERFSRVCECEHTSHFEAPTPRHQRHEYAQARATARVRTPYGVFRVCRECFQQHFQ